MAEIFTDNRKLHGSETDPRRVFSFVQNMQDFAEMITWVRRATRANVDAAWLPWVVRSFLLVFAAAVWAIFFYLTFSRLYRASSCQRCLIRAVELTTPEASDLRLAISPISQSLWQRPETGRGLRLTYSEQIAPLTERCARFLWQNSRDI